MSTAVNSSALYGKPVQFAIGTKDDYLKLINSETFNNACFYIVIDDSSNYTLYLGDQILSGSGGNIEIDSALSSTSQNPVQNKVVNAAIENAIDVVLDDGNIENYRSGVFYYKVSDLDGTKASLKFYINALESIDLTAAITPISTYSATDTINAISGKGVSEALKTLKIYDVTTEPITYESGAFYRIYNTSSNSYKLVYSPSGESASNIVFSDLIPTDHSDSTNKYGAATDTKYGHAKSGIPITENATSLASAYSESDKDSDLVGVITDSYARVDHKHPYPRLTDIASYVDSNDNVALGKQFIGEETYSFIQPGDGYVYLKEDEKIVPANVRIKNIEDSYISSSKTSEQTISSPLIIENTLTLNGNNKLILKNLEVPKVDNDKGTLTLEGHLLTTGNLQITGSLIATTANFTGAITAANQSISAGSLALSSALQADGDISLGKNGNNGYGLIITNPTGSNSSGTALFKYDVTATNLIATNNLTATNLTTTNLTLGSKQITIDITENRTTVGSNINKDRLVVNGVNHLTEYDLGEKGLINSWVKGLDYATNTTVNNLIIVSDTQPTASRKGQLWIRTGTSYGNGALYYYTGSTSTGWKAVSSVWT